MVTNTNTAQAMGSGLVPVYATPALVALLEEAAVNALKPLLEAGKTSVGTRIDISHLAATPIGMIVRAQATLSKVDGRRLVFDVVAHDEASRSPKVSRAGACGRAAISGVSTGEDQPLDVSKQKRIMNTGYLRKWLHLSKESRRAIGEDIQTIEAAPTNERIQSSEH